MPRPEHWPSRPRPDGAAGPLSDGDVDEVAAALRIGRDRIVAHEWCDNGPGWRAVLLDSADEVLALQPDPALAARMDIGVVGPHAAGGPADVEVRAFFPGNGGSLAEDPVTGSLNAALGQWLIGSGRLPERYVARQGTALGRDGRVEVELVDGEVWVGGASVTVLTGSAAL